MTGEFFLCSCRACLPATMATAPYHGRSLLATPSTSSSNNSRYVFVPRMAHFGNHILPIMVDIDTSILVEFQKWLTWHSFLCRVTCVLFYQKWLTWHSEWPMFYSTKIGSLGTSFSVVAYVLLYQKWLTWHSCLYSTNSGTSSIPLSTTSGWKCFVPNVVVYVMPILA